MIASRCLTPASFSIFRSQDDENRSQLFAGRPSGAKAFADMGTTGWGNESDQSVETFDVEGAQRLTQQVIRGTHLLQTSLPYLAALYSENEKMDFLIPDQDAGLEELAKIISRQKNIARAIGDEVDVHNGKFGSLRTKDLF